jgi:DNA-binding transcriptional ArsR family regulator
MTEVLDRQALKALSTDTRQAIIKMLLKRPYTASEISKLLNKHVTTVTEHLSILESSGLVKKKDSTNKWVYYTLTDKGEKLFKPSYYSWVVVLSLSAVFVFTGLLRLFSTGASYSAGYETGALRTQAVAAKASDTVATVPASIPTDMISIFLIILGLVGFAYLCCRAWKRKRHKKEMNIYAEYAVL